MAAKNAALAIRHLHLPGITPFAKAQKLQQSLVQQFLAHKALVSAASRDSPEDHLPTSPRPTILTFTPTPVYTLGRREHGSLANEQKELLLAPLIRPSRRSPSTNRPWQPEIAEIEETQRGGQTTFHGPGQLVIYPIMDLKPAEPFGSYEKGLTVRGYVSLLEQTTIRTLAGWGIQSKTTGDPGVWEKKMHGEEEGGEKKIAALGLHLRRNVASYGVGLNYKTDLEWFERITACGLVGKGVTTMDQVCIDHDEWQRKDRLVRRALGEDERGRYYYLPTKPLEPGAIGRFWVDQFAQGLNGNGSRVEQIAESDIKLESEEGGEDVGGDRV